MAGRRVALKAVDWMAFAERVPPNQRPMFNVLKTRSDALSAKLTSLPETSPAIDWAFYKTTVAKAGMVDEFEKKPTEDGLYNVHARTHAGIKEKMLAMRPKAHEWQKFKALKIPEPVDTQSAKIDAQEQEAAKSAATYIQASKGRIAQYEKELHKFKNMIPFDQMTIDDYNEVFPETKLDKQKYPYWPHKPIADL